MPKPTDITVCSDTGQQTASFSFYDGLTYIDSKGLEQTTSFQKMAEGTHFIVCCGDIMVKVTEEDFPEIPRRSL